MLLTLESDRGNDLCYCFCMFRLNFLIFISFLKYLKYFLFIYFVNISQEWTLFVAILLFNIWNTTIGPVKIEPIYSRIRSKIVKHHGSVRRNICFKRNILLSLAAKMDLKKFQRLYHTRGPRPYQLRLPTPIQTP